MKTALFLGIFLTTVTTGFSQVLVKFTSVPCNSQLEGYYSYVPINDTGWTLMPNMNLSSNAVQGEVVLVNDGSTDGLDTSPLGGTITFPSIYDACESVNWSQDLVGKIAVIYRGNCEFGCKALNAQNRGATGVIIINHGGNFTDLAPGNCGADVSIPVVMLHTADGQAIASCLDTIPTGVTVFIGNKTGLYSNDVGMSKADVVMPNALGIPEVYSSASINLGLWASNYGSNVQTGVTASLDIYRGTTLVSSYTSLPYDFSASTDSTVDKHFFDLGIYNWASIYYVAAYYTLVYKINLPNDEDTTDNVFSVDYGVTLSNWDDFYHSIYSKSRVSTFGEPIATTYRSPVINQGYDNWESCIVLQHPKAGSNGYGDEVLGMVYSLEIDDDDFGSIEIRAYEWNDSIDITVPNVSFDNLNLISSTASFHWYLNNSIPQMEYFNPPVEVLANQKYLFCVYTESEKVKIGYDNAVDYTATINHNLKPIAPIRIKPFSSPEEWIWTGFGNDKGVPAIGITFGYHVDYEPCPPGPCVGIDDVSANNIYSINPNPITTTINLQLSDNQNAAFKLIDITGKQVLTQHLNTSYTQINVQGLPKGIYFYELITEKERYSGKLVIQ